MQKIYIGIGMLLNTLYLFEVKKTGVVILKEKDNSLTAQLDQSIENTSSSILTKTFMPLYRQTVHLRPSFNSLQKIVRLLDMLRSYASCDGLWNKRKCD